MASEKNKNTRRAHLLLGAYWFYMLYRGSKVSGATLDVLKIQRNSLIKEHRERKIAKQDGRTGSGRSGGRARAGLTAGGAQRSLSPEKNRSLFRRIELTEKILKYVFKREHLY